MGDGGGDEEAGRGAGCRFLYVTKGAQEQGEAIETPQTAWYSSLTEVQQVVLSWLREC